MFRGFLTITMLILACSMPALAEGRGSQGSGGISLLGGFNFAHNKSSSAGTIDSKTGTAFGFGFDYRVLPEVVLETNFLNVQKNFQLNRANGTIEAYNLSYFEVPVMVKWTATPNFNLKVGPYLGAFLLSAEREALGSTDPVKGEFKNDYGIALGAWFGFPAKKNMMVGIDFRYDFGLADIQGDSDPASSIYTRSFMSLLTVTFQFK